MRKDPSALGTEDIGKLLVKFSVPAMIGTVMFASTNIVNTVIIGRGVGSIALTAVSLAFPVFSIFMAVGMLVGIGAGSLVSLRLGEGKRDEAEAILGGAFFLLIVFSLAGTVLGLAFLDPVLRAFGASDASLPYARAYLGVFIAGAVFNFMAMGLNNIIRAEGNPGVAMITMVIGAIVNMTLTWFFIFHLKTGLKGAALAAITGNAVSGIWVILHFTGKKSVLTLRLKNMRFDRALMTPALLIGLSPFIMQISASMVGMVANKSLSHYGGDMAVGAMAVINSVALFFIFPIIGLNQGLQPVAGFNYGAKKFDRVTKALKYAAVSATLVSTAGCLAAHLWPGRIIGVFSKDDPALAGVGAHGITIFLAMFFVVGFQAICANYFQAVGRPKASILLNLLRQVILFIPLMLILPLFFGLDGVWASAPISDSIAAVITAAVIFRETKRLNRAVAA